jgi:hypothetical protein
LPAASVQVPATLAAAAVRPRVGAGGRARRDSRGRVAPANETVIGFEYQPFASGPPRRDAPAAGAVASYLSAKPRGALVLPAASRQTPATVAGRRCRGRSRSGHRTTRSRTSRRSLRTSNATAWLYQPLASGARPAGRPSPAGGVVVAFDVTVYRHRLLLGCVVRTAGDARAGRVARDRLEVTVRERGSAGADQETATGTPAPLNQPTQEPWLQVGDGPSSASALAGHASTMTRRGDCDDERPHLNAPAPPCSPATVRQPAPRATIARNVPARAVIARSGPPSLMRVIGVAGRL